VVKLKWRRGVKTTGLNENLQGHNRIANALMFGWQQSLFHERDSVLPTNLGHFFKVGWSGRQIG